MGKFTGAAHVAQCFLGFINCCAAALLSGLSFCRVANAVRGRGRGGRPRTSTEQ